jgi:hypothetical protein
MKSSPIKGFISEMPSICKTNMDSSWDCIGTGNFNNKQYVKDLREVMMNLLHKIKTNGELDKFWNNVQK